MWAALVATINTNPFFLVVFLTLWSVGMGIYLHFCVRVAPVALRRWADAEGYQIVEQNRAGIFDWFSVASGSVTTSIGSSFGTMRARSIKG